MTSIQCKNRSVGQKKVRPKELSRIASDVMSALENRDPFPGLLQPIDPDNRKIVSVCPFDGTRFRYFFLSDIHGDAGLFKTALDKAEKSAQAAGAEPVVVILGDLIDRGPDSADCIAMLLRLCLGLDRRHSGVKVLFVKGDHDEALVPFGSKVSPSELVDELFELVKQQCRRETAMLFLVRAFCDFVRCCPAAVLFDDGILCSHGGVPHSALQESIQSAQDLETPAAAQDFVWCRFSERSPKKFPNRREKTCQIGFQDVDSFLGRLDGLRLCEKPMTVWLHGHAHPAEGFRDFEIPDSRRHVVTFSSFRGVENRENNPVMLVHDGDSLQPIGLD